MRVVGRFGSDGVIAVPGSDDPMAHWDSAAAARRVGNVTVVMDTVWFEAASAAKRDVPEPGQATIETSGGMAGILRHEYGHYIWNRLRDTDRVHFRELIAPFRSDEPSNRGGGNRYGGLEKKLTFYAASNYEEVFTEAFAIWSDPRFDRGRFPADIHPVFDWLERRFAGRIIERAARESNDCHNPAGSPAGGEFCSKGGMLDAFEVKRERERAFKAAVNVQIKHISSNEIYEYVNTPKGRATLHMKNMYTGSDDDPMFELHWLMATKRGAGRAALEHIVRAADAHGVTLRLWAVPLPGVEENEGFKPTKAQLEKLYAEFGFKRKGRRDAGYALMERKPTKPKKARR
jgi:hypothetical protein